jgi:hypothetical protein
MESANQNASDSAGVVDEAEGNRSENAEIHSAANSTEDQVEQEAGTSGANGTATNENRAPTKRNYRRRTESAENSSDFEVEQAVEAVENQAEDQEASESEDVSLDELRVSGSEDGNNQSPRR